MAESKTNCISPGLNTLDSDCATAHNGVTDGHHTDSSLIKKETHLGYAHSVFIKTESVNFVDLAHVTHLHPDQIKTETADGGCIETEQIRALQDMKCIDIEFDDVKLESSEVSVSDHVNTVLNGAGVDKNGQSKSVLCSGESHSKSKKPRKKQSELIQDERIYTGERPYECDLCERSFLKKCHLNRHQRTHTGEKSYACDQCEKFFAEKSYLNIHLRIHSSEKPYKCNWCEKRFNYKGNLISHERIHTGEKPYICDQCGKLFVQKSQLYFHYRIHTGEKPYKCDHCVKRFTSKNALRYHERAHTGEKPYACDQCGKSFTSKDYLNVHQIMHTGEKPYACRQCGKSFARKSCLSLHHRIHTGERPHKCDHCAKCFLRKSDLDRHKRIHTASYSKRNNLNYGTVMWSIEEKKKILHCFAYSRYEKWGRRKNVVFEERIKEADLPTEKKEATTTTKLASIASQIHKYLSEEEMENIKEEAQKQAEKDFQSRKEEEQREFGQSHWKMEEKWVLLWATEYAKAKYTNQRERCREWQRIFHHHCQSKKGIPRSKINTQRHNTLIQKYFTEEEIEWMQAEVTSMINNTICPLTEPLEMPNRQRMPGVLKDHPPGQPHLGRLPPRWQVLQWKWNNQEALRDDNKGAK